MDFEVVNRILKVLLKCAVVVALLTIPLSIAWDASFPGKVYYCTDEVGPGYLMPGDWVHGELEVVEDVEAASSRTMSDPDVIRKGWSTGRLWAIWLLMFGGSVVVGALLARFRWAPQSDADRT